MMAPVEVAVEARVDFLADCIVYYVTIDGETDDPPLTLKSSAEAVAEDIFRHFPGPARLVACDEEGGRRTLARKTYGRR